MQHEHKMSVKTEEMLKICMFTILFLVSIFSRNCNIFRISVYSFVISVISRFVFRSFFSIAPVHVHCLLLSCPLSKGAKMVLFALILCKLMTMI